MLDRDPDVGVLGMRLATVEEALARRVDDGLVGSTPTPAEQRLLTLLDSDLTLERIASEHRFVSMATIKSHQRRLYRRLGVSTRHEAVEAARRGGYCKRARSGRNLRGPRPYGG